MSEMRVTREKGGRTYVYIPAFLRDKFDLQNGDKVDVDTDGVNIILRPKK
jgi:AbrB family looped-hinge helix DNA binding protein